MKTLTQLLDDLVEGTATLADTAETFRHYPWKPQAKQDDFSLVEVAPVEGSFDEVNTHSGLSNDQYEALTNAYRRSGAIDDD